MLVPDILDLFLQFISEFASQLMTHFPVKGKGIDKCRAIHGGHDGRGRGEVKISKSGMSGDGSRCGMGGDVSRCQHEGLMCLLFDGVFCVDCVTGEAAAQLIDHGVPGFSGILHRLN